MILNEYFTELTAVLKRLTEDERREALAFYEEYAAESGIENGDEMKKRFGSARELAAAIYADAAEKQMNPDLKDKEHTVRGFLTGLAALMSVGSFLVLTPLGCGFFALMIWVTKKAMNRMTFIMTKYIKRRACHEA